MKKTSAILLTALFLISCSHFRMLPYITSENPYKGQEATAATLGKPLFVEHCVRCHGVSGMGDGDDLTVPLDKQIADLTDISSEKPINVLAARIAVGKGDVMPAFRGIFTEDQIWQLANYIVSISVLPFSQEESS